jgi:hypothetical protein
MRTNQQEQGDTSKAPRRRRQLGGVTATLFAVTSAAAIIVMEIINYLHMDKLAQ